ncbi:hypothetical protein [Rhodovulum marinum]|uniref:hypothetical protein n=1 Tax=Rhodovulum marinum TaxID=320662 RepID=UPI0010447488|nr:hypothetical protein [Rhodovulum marinum]
MLAILLAVALLLQGAAVAGGSFAAVTARMAVVLDHLVPPLAVGLENRVTAADPSLPETDTIHSACTTTSPAPPGRLAANRNMPAQAPVRSNMETAHSARAPPRQMG